jgi:Cys-tRNA(Pro)/Cys-tRNA(Cys) deacylase
MPENPGNDRAAPGGPTGIAEPAQLAALRALLDAAAARYRILGHDTTVHSARDGAAQGIGALAQMAPTLVLRCGQGYLAAIIGGDRRLSYRKLKKQLGVRDVSLVAPAEVPAITGAEAGAVSMVNPGLRTVLDTGLLAQDEVFGGCGVPRYSLALAPAELVRVTAATVLDFTEPRSQ